MAVTLKSVVGYVFVTVAFASPGLAQQAPPVDPLVLDGATVLSIPGSPRLDFDEGTIEFWVSALWDEDPGYFPCIVSSRAWVGEGDAAAAAATRFSVHITAARDELGLFNGVAWGAVPFDFSDEAYHHVALVTQGGRTEVLIDGESRGVMELGYGSAKGLPLRIGTSDGAAEPFIGALWSLRLWKRPLDPETVAALSGVQGAPDPDDPASAALVAFSQFEAGNPELLLVPEPGE